MHAYLCMLGEGTLFRSVGGSDEIKHKTVCQGRRYCEVRTEALNDLKKYQQLEIGFILSQICFLSFSWRVEENYVSFPATVTSFVTQRLRITHCVTTNVKAAVLVLSNPLLQTGNFIPTLIFLVTCKWFHFNLRHIVSVCVWSRLGCCMTWSPRQLILSIVSS